MASVAAQVAEGVGKAEVINPALVPAATVFAQNADALSRMLPVSAA